MNRGGQCSPLFVVGLQLFVGVVTVVLSGKRVVVVEVDRFERSGRGGGSGRE